MGGGLPIDIDEFLSLSIATCPIRRSRHHDYVGEEPSKERQTKAHPT